MASTQSQSQSQPPQYLKGVVKQVLSGDSVIIRNQPKGGPPPERQINFSNVVAPRLARRGTPSQPETKDEPFAWESREFLRKMLIGKDVIFNVETKTPTGREYGTVYLGKDINDKENVVETMVSEGLLTVRRDSGRGEFTQELAAKEDAAKSQGKGKWAEDEESHIRDMKTIDNPRIFVDKYNGKPLDAIIEHVRDGSTVRVLICLPSEYYQVTLMVSGIRCPMNKMDSDGRVDKGNAEAFADEARYYVESRLLQRDIKVILETHNNNNFVGSIIHPNGNIAELLLREGFAKCVDWSMATVTGGPEKLRRAEKYAKDKKLRMWTSYKPSTNALTGKDRNVVGRVAEVFNGDALTIKCNNGTLRKIFLASIRPPRLQDQGGDNVKPAGRAFRPLYDVPWVYEAREYLRKKLIGQKVTAVIDYIQPKQNQYPEKVCCTVRIGDVNVAEAIVSKGFASVLRYRQDDDQRASCYDDLLSAEAKAVKMGLGIHNKKDIPIHRVADLSGDVAKSKSFLPFLQRAGLTDALVEFVASGSRLRLFIPKETCLITFLLAGISCPRASRTLLGGTGVITPGEAFGDEALAFTKDLILQREVQIEVESMDRGGNFIGWLHFESKNLSVQLVENGLSQVHSSAEGTKFFSPLHVAEATSKEKKIGLFKNFVEPIKVEKIEDVVLERRIDLKRMIISEVTPEGHLFGQYCSDEGALIKLMDSLKDEFTQRPPVVGAYTPRKADLCAAKFSDGAWYRAKVERLTGPKVHVLYVDYGNREVTSNTNCAKLPGGFTGQSLFAHEMVLACTKLHSDEDNKNEAINAIMEEVIDQELLVNREHRLSGVEVVTIQKSETKVDVGRSLIANGFLLVEERKEKRFSSLVSEYRAAQQEAKKKHLNIWQYGDITEDEAHEFGMER